MYYGPEYVSTTMQNWARKRRITLEFIQPGNPQQNAYIERYNRTVRYDWLAQDLFDTLEQVQNCATSWLWFYNHERWAAQYGSWRHYPKKISSNCLVFYF